MRTLITIFSIVILLSVGSITSYQYIQASTQALEVPLETVEQSISSQKWAVAQKELNTTQQLWDKEKTWWTVILDHQEIDTIDLSLKHLEKYLEARDLPLSLGEVSALKLLVDHISDSAKFNLRNIL